MGVPAKTPPEVIADAQQGDQRGAGRPEDEGAARRSRRHRRWAARRTTSARSSPSETEKWRRWSSSPARAWSRALSIRMKRPGAKASGRFSFLYPHRRCHPSPRGEGGERSEPGGEIARHAQQLLLAPSPHPTPSASPSPRGEGWHRPIRDLLRLDPHLVDQLAVGRGEIVDVLLQMRRRVVAAPRVTSSPKPVRRSRTSLLSSAVMNSLFNSAAIGSGIPFGPITKIRTSVE